MIIKNYITGSGILRMGKGMKVKYTKLFDRIYPYLLTGVIFSYLWDLTSECMVSERCYQSLYTSGAYLVSGSAGNFCCWHLEMNFMWQ